jgi:hypothetical protein
MKVTLPKTVAMPLIETVLGDITDISVGFSKIVPSQNPAEVQLAGSGTLVSAGGVRAILTAAHVVSNLPDSGDVGLIAPLRGGGYHAPVIIDMQHVQKILVAKGSDDSQGPDLGLLILSSADWSLLPTGKTFFNLSRRRDKMMNDPHPPLRGIWVICGMVGEWTNNPPKGRLSEHKKGFHGLCMPVVLTKERDQGDFDYLSVQVENNDTYEGPESFGGCSGGGLWRVLIYEGDNGALETGELLLSGVAFYQSWWEGGRNTIECHGRKSIYGKVIETLVSLSS